MDRCACAKGRGEATVSLQGMILGQMFEKRELDCRCGMVMIPNTPGTSPHSMLQWVILGHPTHKHIQTTTNSLMVEFTMVISLSTQFCFNIISCLITHPKLVSGFICLINYNFIQSTDLVMLFVLSPDKLNY